MKKVIIELINDDIPRGSTVKSAPNRKQRMQQGIWPQIGKPATYRNFGTEVYRSFKPFGA